MTAKEKHMLVNLFHSELTGDTRIHAYFIEMISQSKKRKAMIQIPEFLFTQKIQDLCPGLRRL